MQKDAFEEAEAFVTTAAQPLHIQHLEASLNMDNFISCSQQLLQKSLTSSEDSDSDAELTHRAGGRGSNATTSRSTYASKFGTCGCFNKLKQLLKLHR